MKSIIVFYDSGRYFLGVINNEDKDYFYVENLLELVIMLKKSEIELPTQTSHSGPHPILPVLSPIPAGFGLLSNCVIHKKSLKIFRIFSPQEIEKIKELEPLKELLK